MTNSDQQDNWANRSAGMHCGRCMWYVPKTAATVGRCRKHAPTLNGWPVVYDTDWCGDFKLNEERT